ncbi:hypothetical protein DCS_07884 [Drechmeria coniospora]|uniref:Mitochondrial glycine transporter n=1 Tax=Drechmeria coniospora TaxID=98403 RepID=A0A151GFP6_DRECN|nr:hypothetical protein DCS_07884 [Drechmeria coniospora]KYK55919.1 hypothetical protein DCS_07884 [Drechmeria coniospora]
MESTPSLLPTAHHFVSGLGSGVASAVLLQPLDLLKTRVQQPGRPSLLACLRDVQKSTNPIRALWRGTVPSALRTGFGSALYFTSLSKIRQCFHQVDVHESRTLRRSSSSVLPTLTNSANLISGAAARTFSGLVLMPLTVIKVRFESNIYSYSSTWAAALDIRRVYGFQGFFAGFGATCLRDAPYAGLYVLLYDVLKTRLAIVASSHRSHESEQGSMQGWLASSVNFNAAIIAGAACSVISNPFDAIKTRIQLQPRRYRNAWKASYMMVIEDGFLSLWNGLALRMCRKALSSALAWTLYEEFIRKSVGA